MPRKGECLYSPHFVMLLTVGVEHSGCGTSETVGRHECWPGIRCLIHTHAHTHAHTHVHTHSLIHTRTHTQPYPHTRTHTQPYPHTRTHTHTHTALSTRVQRHHLLNNGCMRPTALKHWRVIISHVDFVPGTFKFSVRTISLNPHDRPVREGPLLFPFYR